MPVRRYLIALGALASVAVATPSWGQVTGIVRDANTLLPIQNAIVTLQGTANRVTTNAVGAYTLNVTGMDLVVVAASQGYYHSNGAPVLVPNPVTTPAVLNFDLTPVAAANDPNYTWRANLQCGFCHADQFGQYGDINAADPSPMSITGINQWVYDLYNGTGTPGGMGGFVYTQDSIHAATFPEAECASCHQPQRWLNAPFSALQDINTPTVDSLASVSCEMCHKTRDVIDPKATGFYPGAVVVTRPVEAGVNTQQVMYGPLGDVDFIDPLAMYPSYNPDIRHETCSVCHEYNSDPDQDGDFNEPGSFPGQTTYSEWQASSFGNPMSPNYMTCADCHMPAVNNDGCIIVPVPRIAGQIRSHHIRGTSQDFLENAVTMSMTVNVVGTDAQVQVSITNDQAGHDVPTGISLRNVILWVEAIQVSNGQPLAHAGAQVLPPEAGVGNPAIGQLAGLPGKLYGRLIEDAGGNGPVPFTDAVAERFNTRIPAGVTDVTNYTFSGPPTGGDVTFRARLIHRRAWRSLVEDKGWVFQGDGVTPLKDIQAPHFGSLMEENVEVVFVPGTGAQQFVRGNCNADSSFNIADAISLLAFLFPSGTPTVLACEDACDCNDDGNLNIADAICVLSALFGAATVPPQPPHPGCGVDPTPGDPLGCDSFLACP